MIRKALVKDVSEIHKLLGYYANQGDLLPRSLSELYDHLRDYSVIEDDEGEGAIIAVCALGVCWEGLGEIRSLAVAKEYQGRNIGTQLVEGCLEEALSLGLDRIFVLTYVPEFFAGMGFKKIEKSTLPHKIWADCLKCPKFPDCDETALIKAL
jgi:amino-acid N-acetyltransferase